MKQTNALAYLRQLCCLELDKEIVIAEFLRAVRMIIPSDSNIFTACDAQLNPIYAILEHTTPKLDFLIPDILPDFFNWDRRLRFTLWFSEYPIATEAALLDRQYSHTDLDDLLRLQNDRYHSVTTPVLVDGRPAGKLCLFRSRSQKPFTDCEQALCSRLTPYLAHALQARNGDDIQYGDHGVSGMLIMDAKGAVLHLSETARSLLALTRQPALSVNNCNNESASMPPLAELCLKLEAMFQGEESDPPCWTFTNGLGRFNFRAYRLDKQNPEPGGLIGLTIEHQEPLPLKLLRAMQHLPLSPTQKEVALLVAQGVSSEKIGERLHIKPTTVKDHVGKIFTKLDIHHRDQLLPKLLALENTHAAPH